jgi:hypothetical protein
MSSILYLIPIAIIIWFILHKLRQKKLNESPLPNLDLDETAQIYEAKYHEAELRQKVNDYYERHHNDPIPPSLEDLEGMVEGLYIHEKMKYLRRHKLGDRYCYKHLGVARVSSFSWDDYFEMLYTTRDKVLKEFIGQV